MSTFHFPQPNERHNTSAVPVPDPVLCNVLYLAAIATRDSRCNDDECPDCHNNRASCAEAFALLPGQYQRLLDLWLAEEEHITPREWRL